MVSGLPLPASPTICIAPMLARVASSECTDAESENSVLVELLRSDRTASGVTRSPAPISSSYFFSCHRTFSLVYSQTWRYKDRHLLLLYRYSVASNYVLCRVLARIHGRRLRPPYHLKSVPLPSFFSTQNHESVYCISSFGRPGTARNTDFLRGVLQSY